MNTTRQASAKPPVSSAVVTPPPGKAQTAILTVFNPDGQNSQFLQAANPLHILFQSTDTGDYRHQPCLIADGCGSHGRYHWHWFQFHCRTDERRIRNQRHHRPTGLRASPNHLQADVSVASGAVLSSPDVSVFSGFQQAWAVAGSILRRLLTVCLRIPTLTNALPGLMAHTRAPSSVCTGRILPWRMRHRLLPLTALQRRFCTVPLADESANSQWDTGGSGSDEP